MTITEQLAAMAAIGFAIQRLLEIFDLVVTVRVRRHIDEKKPKYIKETELKTTGMAVLAFLLGLGASLVSGIRLLKTVNMHVSEFWDVVATALVLGAGTEGVNFVMKFFNAVKDERRKAAAKST